MIELPLLVGELHYKLDEALAASQSRFAPGPPRCARSCDHCCHYMVQATLVEAFVVYKAMPAGRMERVREYRDAFLARLAERGDPKDDEEAALLAWGLACPLLEDGACTVYESRPIACRACHSYSDPALCGQVRSNVIRDPGSREIAEQALDLAQKLEDAVGLPHRTALLPFLLYALDREAGPTPGERLEQLAARLRGAVPEADP